MVLLRHGQSQANKDGVWGGWLDSPLTDKGVLQAENAGIFLKQKGYQFDIAFTSMLSRAQVTCEKALKGIGQLGEIPIIKTYHLNETHFGDFTGLTTRSRIFFRFWSCLCLIVFISFRFFRRFGFSSEVSDVFDLLTKFRIFFQIIVFDSKYALYFTLLYFPLSKNRTASGAAINQ